MKVKNITKKKSFSADLADGIFLQARGLSFSKRKRGMLFTFPVARKWRFWMFGMSYDIWIAFLDTEKRVFDMVYARKMTLNPKTWRVYKPKKPCKYVLEMPKKVVNIGDKLRF